MCKTSALIQILPAAAFKADDTEMSHLRLRRVTNTCRNQCLVCQRVSLGGDCDY